MRLAITGGHGFLGWHVAARLHTLHPECKVRRLGRNDFADPASLTRAVGASDVVLHLAGVNRADSDEAVETGNSNLAEMLASAIRTADRPIRIVYANSIQAEHDNPYGRGKAAAGLILRVAAVNTGGSFADVVLPNIFGEHGRPHYNSFVATFCHAVARGEKPTVTHDREVPLLHAQAAANALLEAAWDQIDTRMLPVGRRMQVSHVLGMLREFHMLYSRGDIPALTDDFRIDLFNTYRSHVFRDLFPIYPQLHADARGVLFETARSHGGSGQAFVSTTRPGFTRGDHYHLRKVERFVVVQGQAEIALRRLLTREIVRFRIDGSRPAYIDMPTMWVHNITNIGESELVTMFWADQLLDPTNLDQFPERVVPEEFL